MILKAKISLILCILGILLASTHLTKADAKIDQTFSRSLESFGFRLSTEFAAENPQKDIVFSPFSIETCLAMVRMGSEGQTADEIDKALDLSANDFKDLPNNFHSVLEVYQNSSILKIANKIYAMTGYEIQDEYNELLTQQFFSSVDSLDFTRSVAAAETINTWVECETNNTIKNLVNPDLFDEFTRLVLVNAIYFKGNWVHQFIEKSTKESDFYLDEIRTVKVQMMHRIADFNYTNLPELDATAVELPYKNSDLSMLIVLPNTRNGLAKLENELKNTSLSYITERMKLKEVIVKIPKFKAEFQADLRAPLSNMGMKRMFSDEAEFGKMLKSTETLYISSAIHKAFIEVNERGTEAAAAATFFGATPLMLGDDPERFYADHGFLYYIRSKNGIVLFEGKQAFIN